jgi:hypothetical protein
MRTLGQRIEDFRRFSLPGSQEQEIWNIQADSENEPIQRIFVEEGRMSILKTLIRRKYRPSDQQQSKVYLALYRDQQTRNGILPMTEFSTIGHLIEGLTQSYSSFGFLLFSDDLKGQREFVEFRGDWQKLNQSSIVPAVPMTPPIVQFMVIINAFSYPMKLKLNTHC